MIKTNTDTATNCRTPTPPGVEGTALLNAMAVINSKACVGARLALKAWGKSTITMVSVAHIIAVSAR